jgi:hypothetical protein
VNKPAERFAAVPQAEVQPIVDLLKASMFAEAEEAYVKLRAAHADMSDYDAMTLAASIGQASGKMREYYDWYNSRQESPLPGMSQVDYDRLYEQTARRKTMITDGTILQLLEGGPKLLVELVAATKVTATAVRVKLERLMNKGLVTRDKVVLKQGRGRPAWRYEKV